MSRRGLAWGFLYGSRAAVYIYVVGGRLTPDSGDYAQGHSAWSSPALALSGWIGGWQGVCVAGCFGASALGYLVGSHTSGVLRPAALALSPPGWYTIQPSADAIGASAAIVATSRTPALSRMGFVAAFHLEAALVILGAWVLGRLFSLRLDVATCIMGALAQWHPTFHFQMRYFLPGFALLAIGRGRFGENSLGRTYGGFHLRHSRPYRYLFGLVG